MNQTDDTQVSVMDMLIARDRRVTIQSTLLRTYHVPLISFTLNIPGPVKILDKIPEVFKEGCEQIEHVLERNKISFYREQIIEEKTGYEAFYCTDGVPKELKKLMTVLEDQNSIGRLYDIDVLGIDGIKISREDLGLPARSCLLCSEPAHSCSRSRRHTVEELIERIHEILSKI